MKLVDNRYNPRLTPGALIVRHSEDLSSMSVTSILMYINDYDWHLIDFDDGAVQDLEGLKGEIIYAKDVLEVIKEWSPDLRLHVEPLNCRVTRHRSLDKRFIKVREGHI